MAQGEWAATTELIEAALAILEAENPMTIRQLLRGNFCYQAFTLTTCECR